MHSIRVLSFEVAWCAEAVACVGSAPPAVECRVDVDCPVNDSSVIGPDDGSLRGEMEVTVSDTFIGSTDAIPQGELDATTSDTGAEDAPDSSIARDERVSDASALDQTSVQSSEAAPDSATGVIFQSVAPTASRFGWQSLQADFVDTRGNACTGQITIAVSDHAVCYENAAAQMVCAGFTYMTNYGPRFVSAGQADVDQIMLSATFTTATGNAVCVHNTRQQILCFGDDNRWGQFGNGTTGPSASWVQWGGSSLFGRIATGTWDQICALDSMGAVFCSGNSFGTTPVRQLSGTLATSLWIDTFGALHANDTTTFRASDGRAGCTVVASGLYCVDPGPVPSTSGVAGAIVSGGANQGMPCDGGPPGGPLCGTPCWGDSSGRAFCAGTPVFTSVGNVLYVATNLYSSDVCVVSDDGSIWCMGNNSNGELGTGDTKAVTVPTQVQPSGSVSVSCH